MSLLHIDGYYVVNKPPHCYGIAIHTNKIGVFKDAKILSSGWFIVEGNKVSLKFLKKLNNEERKMVTKLVEELICT